MRPKEQLPFVPLENGIQVYGLKSLFDFYEQLLSTWSAWLTGLNCLCDFDFLLTEFNSRKILFEKSRVLIFHFYVYSFVEFLYL